MRLFKFARRLWQGFYALLRMHHLVELQQGRKVDRFSFGCSGFFAHKKTARGRQ
jgi:hypothetical protein